MLKTSPGADAAGCLSWSCPVPGEEPRTCRLLACALALISQWEPSQSTQMFYSPILSSANNGSRWNLALHRWHKENFFLETQNKAGVLVNVCSLLTEIRSVSCSYWLMFCNRSKKITGRITQYTFSSLFPDLFLKGLMCSFSPTSLHCVVFDWCWFPVIVLCGISSHLTLTSSLTKRKL